MITKLLIFFGVMVAWGVWYFLSSIVGLMSMTNVNDPTAQQIASGHLSRAVFMFTPLIVLVLYRTYCIFVKGDLLSSFIKNDLIYIIGPLLLLIAIGFMQYGPEVFKLH